MRKLALIFCTLFTLMFTSSCDVYGQFTDAPYELEYEYTYNNNPVFLVNGIYYWYTLVDNMWCYRPLPKPFWGHIRHMDRPIRGHFNRPFRGHGDMHFNPQPKHFGTMKSSTRETVHFGGGNHSMQGGHQMQSGGHSNGGHFGGGHR